MRRLAWLLVVLSALLLAPAPLHARTARARLSAEYQRRRDKVDRKDAAAFVQLAEWCRASRLFEEEKEALSLALRGTPDHEPARTRLDALLKEEALHRDWKTPWRREVKPLVIETNTSEAKLQTFCDTASAFYARFGKIFKVPKGPLEAWGKPIHVKVFRTRADFDAYQKAQGDDDPGESTVGYYSLDDKELVLYDDPADPRETLDTLFHEGTHLFMHLVLGKRYEQVPHWLHEGLAEFFGPSRYLPEKEDLDWGRPSLARLATARDLLEAEPPKLRDLLVTRPDDFDSDQYALAWALVHLLVEKKSAGRHVHRDAFVSYLDAVATGKDPLKTFSEVIGPFEQIEREWHAWIKDVPLPPYEHALVLVEQEKYAQAVPLFKRHLDKEPLDPIARFELGEALFMLDKHDEAIAAYKKAIELDGTYAEAESALGWALATRGDPGKGLPHAERAVELSPTGDSWYWLAATRVVAGKKAEARAAIAEARKLLGDTPELADLEKQLAEAGGAR